MQSLTLEACAKINLSLDITGVRPDGYHLLTTVMQSVSLTDRVYIELDRQGNGLILLSDDPSIPLDDRNTAYKAARRYLDATGMMAGVRIYIEKSIPVEAGLAGGSTDAAAVLHGLNELCGKLLSMDQLLELATAIGADVPFCLQGGTILCTGVGEILTPLEAFARVPLILIKPDFGISTPWAFQRYDENPASFHPNHSQLFSAMQRRDLLAMQAATANVLEDISFKAHLVLESIKQMLLDEGAGMAMMSGSGPSIFGLFRETARRDRAYAALEKRLPDGYRIFSATTRGQGLRTV